MHTRDDSLPQSIPHSLSTHSTFHRPSIPLPYLYPNSINLLEKRLSSRALTTGALTRDSPGPYATPQYLVATATATPTSNAQQLAPLNLPTPTATGGPPSTQRRKLASHRLSESFLSDKSTGFGTFGGSLSQLNRRTDGESTAASDLLALVEPFGGSGGQFSSGENYPAGGGEVNPLTLSVRNRSAEGARKSPLAVGEERKPPSLSLNNADNASPLNVPNRTYSLGRHLPLLLPATYSFLTSFSMWFPSTLYTRRLPPGHGHDSIAGCV